MVPSSPVRPGAQSNGLLARGPVQAVDPRGTRLHPGERCSRSGGASERLVEVEGDPHRAPELRRIGTGTVDDRPEPRGKGLDAVADSAQRLACTGVRGISGANDHPGSESEHTGCRDCDRHHPNNHPHPLDALYARRSGSPSAGLTQLLARHLPQRGESRWLPNRRQPVSSSGSSNRRTAGLFARVTSIGYHSRSRLAGRNPCRPFLCDESLDPNR